MKVEKREGGFVVDGEEEMERELVRVTKADTVREKVE